MKVYFFLYAFVLIVVQVIAYKMPRIPVIEKFRGDNDQSFRIWLSMFEAQMQALGTSHRNVLSGFHLPPTLDPGPFDHQRMPSQIFPSNG